MLDLAALYSRLSARKAVTKQMFIVKETKAELKELEKRVQSCSRRTASRRELKPVNLLRRGQ